MVAPFLQRLSASRARNRRRNLLHRHRGRRLRRRHPLWRTSGAGHDRGLARPAAALRDGGHAAICCAAWAAEASARICCDHSCIRTRFASGALLDWEFEKDGRVVKVSPPAEADRELSAAWRCARPRTVSASGDLRRLCRGRPSSPARWSACSTTGARRFPDRFCITRAGASRRRRLRRSSVLSRNGASRSDEEARRCSSLSYPPSGEEGRPTACSAARGPAACGRRGRCGC